MPAKITSAVRYLFVSTLITGCLVAGLETVSADARVGVNSCGWKGNPCRLEPLVVKAPRADAAKAVIAQR